METKRTKSQEQRD